MTARVEIYATQSCPYCHAARGLLQKKGVDYELIDVGREPERRAEMTQRAHGRRTVPQIYIGDTHVGGYDDLSKLDREGGLVPLLQAA